MIDVWYITPNIWTRSLGRKRHTITEPTPTTIRLRQVLGVTVCRGGILRQVSTLKKKKAQKIPRLYIRLGYSTGFWDRWSLCIIIHRASEVWVESLTMSSGIKRDLNLFNPSSFLFSSFPLFSNYPTYLVTVMHFATLFTLLGATITAVATSVLALV